MKYLITENQRSNVIDKFITHLFDRYRKITPEEDPNMTWWVDDDDIIILELNEFAPYNQFHVDDKVWTTIQRMLSLDYLDIKRHIGFWIRKHLGIEYCEPLIRFGSEKIPRQYRK